MTDTVDLGSVDVVAPRALPQSSNPVSFVERQISVTITLGEGTFGQTGMNTWTSPPGARIAATISKNGYPGQDQGDIRIYGMTQDVMNQIVTLTVLPTMQRLQNTVLVKAGDATNGMAVVFYGNTTSAWKNLDGSPDTFFNINAVSAAIDALKPAPASSFPGTSDVALVMSGLAGVLGYTFQNSGVQVKLSNVYLAGTAVAQAQKLARAANIEMAFDSSTSPTTLAIWPKNKTRGSLIPSISAATGLIGYPTYRDLAMKFRCLFNPSIVVGGQIQFQSTTGGSTSVNSSTSSAQELRQAGPNGYWYVQAPLTYDLAAQIPDGPWWCDVVCARGPGLPTVTP